MKAPSKYLSLGLLLTIIHIASSAKDILQVGQVLRDNETMVSTDDTFELGFFRPGNSLNLYLGVWYKNIKVKKVLWVANREDPLTTKSGVLMVVDLGILVLKNETNGTVWSSKMSRSVANPVAQLLDSGNLVIRDANEERVEKFLWQSFDYPTDTGIPGMKFGWNLVTQVENYFVPWASEDDPAPGKYSYHLDLSGYPQVFMKEGSRILHRFGPWNGLNFSGGPNELDNPNYKLRFDMNQKEVYYWQETTDPSFFTIFSVNWTGLAERWIWVDDQQHWHQYIEFPADICDNYGWCGANGNCDSMSSPSCACLDRFEPKDRRGWARANYIQGCIRKTNLSCEGDTFLKYRGIKLPDARYAWSNPRITLEECRKICSENCSCMAYTQLDTNKGTGCLIWKEDLIDIRSLSVDGQDIYIRLASSEAENSGDSKRNKRKTVLIASVASVVGILLFGLCLLLYVRKRSYNPRIITITDGTQNEHHGKNLELPLFDLSVILKATANFSIQNKIGEGGFGPVYKGMLDEGQEIAVKRLSKDSMQGHDEFNNEVIFIAKLQHRNLVRLLGGCIQGEENMLIYEYMSNKSLDMFLFDKTQNRFLDWKKRFHIINGIARGLLYLHQDSRLRIIHRDLKASNILLDADLNPKISDFGMARSFGENEIEAKTRRVVGTYGYMSPEYAIDGLFSVKSDVFSFGVIVLEIVTGMRNRGFFDTEHNLNLLGHAWTCYKEGRPLELLDPSLDESMYYSEILRVIHVGLLCVQLSPEDRPSMSTVVLLLGNEGVFPQAKPPGFFTERDVSAAHSSTSTNGSNSVNEVTITMAMPR